jgi:hypothetical protein
MVSLDIKYKVQRRKPESRQYDVLQEQNLSPAECVMFSDRHFWRPHLLQIKVKITCLGIQKNLIQVLPSQWYVVSKKTLMHFFIGLAGKPSGYVPRM